MISYATDPKRFAPQASLGMQGVILWAPAGPGVWPGMPGKLLSADPLCYLLVRQ